MAKSSPPKRTKRRNNPDATKRDILTTATQEFATYGLSGARVDRIAKRMRTSKRMIYYYFGGKEALYCAVLEQAYAGIRTSESELELESLPPAEALKKLVEMTFDYEEMHPDFINLVSIENLNRAKYLSKTSAIRAQNSVIISRLEGILSRGRADGTFRTDISALDAHMAISALCFFRVSNRHTINALFSVDLSAPRTRNHHKKMIGDAILRLMAP